MAERLLDSIDSTRIQAERAVCDKFGRDIYNTYAEREKVVREVERLKPLVGSGAPTETPQYEGQVYVDPTVENKPAIWVGLQGQWHSAVVSLGKIVPLLGHESEPNACLPLTHSSQIGVNTGDAALPCVNVIGRVSNRFTYQGTDYFVAAIDPEVSTKITFNGEEYVIPITTKCSCMVIQDDANRIMLGGETRDCAVVRQYKGSFVQHCTLSFALGATGYTLVAVDNITIVEEYSDSIEFKPYFFFLKKVAYNQGFNGNASMATGETLVTGNSSNVLGNVCIGGNAFQQLFGSNILGKEQYDYGLGTVLALTDKWNYAVGYELMLWNKYNYAFGEHLATAMTHQIVLGSYNKLDSTHPLVIASGASADNPMNCLVADADGNLLAFNGTEHVLSCKTATSVPDTAPDYVGQEYLDTANNNVYKALGTSSASDWKEMASKEYVDGIVGDIESLLAAL